MTVSARCMQDFSQRYVLEGPLDRAVRILLHERHSFSGELPTGLEIALEDDLKDKIDKAFINPAQIKSQHRIGKGTNYLSIS